MTQTTDVFPELQGHEYIRLTTFRKSGEPVPTPVWFAISHGKAYILTGRSLGKTKRIRNNPRVEMTPCNQNGQKTLGPTVEGQARVLEGNDEAAVPGKIALNRKYGFMKALFDFFFALTGRDKETVYLEISPV
jgi:hypothetical protein